jgi:hypothetical protein
LKIKNPRSKPFSPLGYEMRFYHGLVLIRMMQLSYF